VNWAEGFEGFDARTSDSDNPRGDGAIRGLDYVAPRTVAFELSVIEYYGQDDTYEDYWNEVRTAFRPSREGDSELTFKRPGMPERMIRCRPIQLTRKEEYKRYNIVGFPPVVLRAVDPRIYSTETHSVLLQPYSASIGGVDLPNDLPINFGVGSQIEVNADNEGNADAYPLVRFYGPTAGTVEGVTLTNVTTGDVLEVTTDVLTNQILTADMTAAVTGTNNLVISLDDSTRYGAWQLPRKAFALAPGSNTLRFEVDGTSTDAQCLVQWRDTWMD
jgi:hypothetical protein